MPAGRGAVVKNQKFEMLDDPELPRVLSGVTLQNCWIFACHYGMTAKTPAERRHIRNIDIVGCKATNNSWIGPVIVEDVEINGFQTGGLCIAWGAAFRHVRIRGRCGRFMLAFLSEAANSPEKIRWFGEANKRVYEETDWALDISEGEFEEFDIRNVPAGLVRRDPETQVVVRRDRAQLTQEVWRKLDLSGTPWAIALSNMLEWGREDTVLVAPKRKRDFARWLAGLRLLQKEGVAESD